MEVHSGSGRAAGEVIRMATVYSVSEANKVHTKYGLSAPPVENGAAELLVK